MVLTHARALLTGTLTSYIDADLHDPDRILAAAAQTLDLTRPVALILMNILGHVPEASDARRIVARLMSALPPGSHLVVADGTNVIRGDEFEAAIAVWNASGSLPYHLRTPDQILEIIGDLDLLEPGIVPCPRWRPDTDDPAALREVDEFGLVARKRA